MNKSDYLYNLRVKRLQEGGKPEENSFRNTILDILPIIGDWRAIKRAVKDPTFENIAGAGVGLGLTFATGGLGKSALKIITKGSTAAMKENLPAYFISLLSTLGGRGLVEKRVKESKNE